MDNPYLDVTSLDEKEVLHFIALVINHRFWREHLFCEHQGYVLNGLWWQVSELRHLYIRSKLYSSVNSIETLLYIYNLQRQLQN